MEEWEKQVVHEQGSRTQGNGSRSQGGCGPAAGSSLGRLPLQLQGLVLARLLGF